MKRKITVKQIIILICMIFTFIIYTGAQEDTMIINNSPNKNKERPPVMFPHGLHINDGIECFTCHHEYKGNKNIIAFNDLAEGNNKIKCSACHNDDSKFNLEQAYHIQCIDCHKGLHKSGKASGPRLCADCHPLKKNEREFVWLSEKKNLFLKLLE